MAWTRLGSSRVPAALFVNDFMIDSLDYAFHGWQTGSKTFAVYTRTKYLADAGYVPPNRKSALEAKMVIRSNLHFVKA
jgi:hypothetical protein